MLIDTHVHLDDAKYDLDREAMLQRARGAGVGAFVTIGTNLEDSRWAARFAADTADVYASVGRHPEQVEGWRESELAELEQIAGTGKVVAIGEVGLDYHSPGFDREAQAALFRKMIALSRRQRLPLVIHQRDAAEDTLGILKEEGAGAEGGVFHCFAGDLATAQRAMDLNFDIAVGGILTFPSAGALREVIRQVPLDRLLLETDGPWLAPQPWRGKRNEPAFVTGVAAALAELKGLPLPEVEARTSVNAKRVFRI